MKKEIQEIVEKLMLLLVNKQFDEVEKFASHLSTSISDFKRAMEEYESYGIHFIPPPPEAYKKMIVGKIVVSELPSWFAIVQFWSEEEGESDLSLDATVIKTPEGWKIELDDILVH